jgi:hypothetical protein
VIADDVTSKFPDLMVVVDDARGVKVSETNPRLEEFKEEIFPD